MSNAPATPTDPTAAHIAHLEAASQMLGRIGLLVEAWCPHEDVTTEDAVKLALCELQELRARAERRRIYEAYGLS